jgi:hypothetical protein
MPATHPVDGNWSVGSLGGLSVSVIVGSGRSDGGGVAGLLEVAFSGAGLAVTDGEGAGEEADAGDDEAGDSAPLAQPAMTAPAATARPIRNVA